MLVSNICFDWLGPTFLRFYEARRSEPATFATFVHIFILIVLISAAVGLVIRLFHGFGLANIPAYLFGLILAWGYSWFELVSQLEIANFRPLRYLRMSVCRAALILVGSGAAAWLTRDPSDGGIYRTWCLGRRHSGQLLGAADRISLFQSHARAGGIRVRFTRCRKLGDARTREQWYPRSGRGSRFCRGAGSLHSCLCPYSKQLGFRCQRSCFGGLFDGRSCPRTGVTCRVPNGKCRPTASCSSLSWRPHVWGLR